MAENTDNITTPGTEHDPEATAVMEELDGPAGTPAGGGGAPGPEPKKVPRKALLGAVAAGVVAVVLGVGVSVAVIPPTSGDAAPAPDTGAAVSAASPSGAKPGSAASAPAASASASAAGTGGEAAPSGAAEATAAAHDGEDRHEATQAQGTDGGTHAAPAETASAPAGGDNAAAPAQAAHEHSWEPIYAEVQVGEEPIYETRDVIIFNDGYICYTQAEASAHAKSAGRGANLSYYVDSENTQVGTRPIYENQIVGYRCSECGAEK